MTDAENHGTTGEPDSTPAADTWWSGSEPPASPDAASVDAATPSDPGSATEASGIVTGSSGTSTPSASWYNVGVPIDQAPDPSTWAQGTHATAATPSGAPLAAPPPFAGPPTVPPQLAAAPAPPRRSRNIKGPLIGAALLAGLGYGGYIGYGLLFGATGGSESPEAAVQRAVDAVDNADIPGVLASMSPRELNGIDEVGRKALQIADDALGTKGAKERATIDPEVDDVELEAEELAPGVSKVTVKSLRASVTANKSAVAAAEGAVAPAVGDQSGHEGPVKATLRVRGGDRVSGDSSQGSSKGDFEEDLSDSLGREGEVFAIAVQEEGGWYISPILTAAEYTRLYFDNDQSSDYYKDLPAPDWELLARPDDLKKEFDPGEEKPEDAVDAAVDMLADGDIESLIKAVPSDSGAAVAVFGDSIRKIGDREDLSANSDLRDEMEGFSIDGEIVSNEDGIALYRVSEVTADRDRLTLDGTQKCGDNDGVPTSSYGLEAAIGCAENQSKPLVPLRAMIALREIEDGDRTGWKIDPALSIIESAKTMLDEVTGAELAASIGSLSVDRDPAHVVSVAAEKGKIVSAAPKFDKTGYTIFEVTAPPKSYVQFWPVDKAGKRTAFAGTGTPQWGSFSVGGVSKSNEITGAFQGRPAEMLVASATGKIRIGVLAFGNQVAKMNFAITEVLKVDVPDSGIETSLTDVPISLIQPQATETTVDVTSTGISGIEEQYGDATLDDLSSDSIVAARPYDSDTPDSLEICSDCDSPTTYMVVREPGAKTATLTLTPQKGGFPQGDSFTAVLPFNQTFRVLPGKQYQVFVSASSTVDPEIRVFGDNGSTVAEATSGGSTDSVNFHLESGFDPEDLNVEISPYTSGYGSTVSVTVQTSDY